MATRAAKRNAGKAKRTARPKPANPDVPSVAPPAKPYTVAAILIGFATVFAALQLVSYLRQSATWDEPGHLLAGYAALVESDYRVDISHPPLVRIWAALPLLWMNVDATRLETLDRSTPEAVAFQGPFETAAAFLYRDNDADRLLYRARFMIVLLGIGLGILVFLWAREWLGIRAAVIALALYLTEPNLAAQSSLVTTDLGVTFFIFAAIYFLWRTTHRRTVLNAGMFALFFGLAVLTKFSAVVLLPLVMLLLGLTGFRHGASLRIGHAAGLIVLSVAVAILAIWACYGFREAPSRTAGWTFRLHEHPAARQSVPLTTATVGWIDAHGVLPNAFSEGFLHSQGLGTGRPAFLLGQYSTFGWWYYFPAAFLLKTPLALLALFLVGTGVSLKKHPAVSAQEDAFVIVPILLYTAAAMTTALNIGVRHILPVYPFVILLAARGADALSGLWTRRGNTVIAALVVAAAVEFGSTYPYPLAFFNVMGGGPGNGFRYLSDSNVDWGQGLKPLKAWMARQNVDHINLAYFGTADPRYYGMNVTHLWGTTLPGIPPATMGPPRLPGYVAVSVTLLEGVPFDDRTRHFYRPLRDRKPAATVGGSIRVYWVDAPWW